MRNRNDQNQNSEKDVRLQVHRDNVQTGDSNRQGTELGEREEETVWHRDRHHRGMGGSRSPAGEWPGERS